MTATASKVGALIPAQIDLDTLLDLATFHFGAAAERGRDFEGPQAGTMANYLLKIDEYISELDANDDVFLLRELIDRLGGVFRVGVEFGIAASAAIVNQPLGNSKLLFTHAAKEAKRELNDLKKDAIKDAARVHEAARNGT